MKCRVDFVTNSSSSSFVVLDINSHSFADIIRRFKDELNEQGWYQINELDDSHVSLYGDEVIAQIPSDINDIVSCLARLFYEEVYVPDDYCTEEDEEYVRKEFEEKLNTVDEDDCSFSLEMRIAKDIADAKESIESDLEYIKFISGAVGWGGDDDSRYEESSYDEETLNGIYKYLAEKNHCTPEEVSYEDFCEYVGSYSSSSEDTFEYDKKTGKVEKTHDYSLD